MEPKPVESSMLRWGNKMKAVAEDQDRAFIEAMSASRFSGWDKVEELGLPSYERTIIPLQDFLQAPETNLPADDHRNWFVLFEPHKPTGSRLRKQFLKRAEILNFVKQTIMENNLSPEDYDLAIVETRKEEYGGNIIIDKNNDVLIEVSKGGQGVVADGTHDSNKHGPLFRVSRDPILRTFKYSWEDGEITNNIPLREYVYDALMNIPSEGEGRERIFQQGYYEFHLVKDEKTQRLKPIFVDARTDPSLTTLR